MKMYIAVLDEFPDYMTPTLVAHAMLGAHLNFMADIEIINIFDEEQAEHLKNYKLWLSQSFKKCVVRVNQREFDKIAALSNVYLAHEKHTLEGRTSCVVVCPMPDEQLPNVLRFARLWKPKTVEQPKPHIYQTMAECDCTRPECVTLNRCAALDD